MHAGEPTNPLKRDVLGRITTPQAQREALLDEFERSGLKGKPFAKLAGVNYPAFASWIQKRRRARGDYAARALATKPLTQLAAPNAAPLRLLEAVLAPTADASSSGCATPSGAAPAAPALVVMLGGDAKMLIADAGQVPLAAQLIQSLRASC